MKSIHFKQIHLKWINDKNLKIKKLKEIENTEEIKIREEKKKRHRKIAILLAFLSCGALLIVLLSIGLGFYYGLKRDYKENLICNSTSSYANADASKCLEKKNEGINCSHQIECLGDMICSINKKCECLNSTIEYFDLIQLKCLNKTIKGFSCNANSTCREDLELYCQNGTCECDSTVRYWSSVQLTCVGCPSGWTIHKDKCYFVFNNLSTWDDAQAACNSKGANLVTIREQSDFEMVSSYYSQYTNYMFLWTGARQNVTYDFYWRDGVTLMNQTWPNSTWWCGCMYFAMLRFNLMTLFFYLANPNNAGGGCSSTIGTTTICQGCVRMQKWPNGCDDVITICDPGICLNDWSCAAVHALLCERGNFLNFNISYVSDLIYFFFNKFKE
jgi:hypothetical protein